MIENPNFTPVPMLHYGDPVWFVCSDCGAGIPETDSSDTTNQMTHADWHANLATEVMQFMLQYQRRSA